MFAGAATAGGDPPQRHLVLRRADRLAARARRPGRRARPLPRRRPPALDVEGHGRPAAARPEATRPARSRSRPVAVRRPVPLVPEDEDDATRPHALLAALAAAGRPSPPHAMTPPPAERLPRGSRAPSPACRSPSRSPSAAATAARPPIGLPERRSDRRRIERLRATARRRRIGRCRGSGRRSSARLPAPLDEGIGHRGPTEEAASSPSSRSTSAVVVPTPTLARSASLPARRAGRAAGARRTRPSRTPMPCSAER